MESRLQKWGNSSGIRIPSSFLKSLGLKNDDKIEIVQGEDSIIISKPKKRHLTLEERIEMYEKASDSEKGNIESYDWGEDLGKEIID
ncbi:MAG: AbrB/MazE/SpoVT family DNA-binding domain-containing protein [Bacilli bacterium]|nr:AbrB/MazE/SpoVT family DNA-binding domain-containing protein [Bacilli bacterium]